MPAPVRPRVEGAVDTRHSVLAPSAALQVPSSARREGGRDHNDLAPAPGLHLPAQAVRLGPGRHVAYGEAEQLGRRHAQGYQVALPRVCGGHVPQKGPINQRNPRSPAFPEQARRLVLSPPIRVRARQQNGIRQHRAVPVDGGQQQHSYWREEQRRTQGGYPQATKEGPAASASAGLSLPAPCVARPFGRRSRHGPTAFPFPRTARSARSPRPGCCPRASAVHRNPPRWFRLAPCR